MLAIVLVAYALLLAPLLVACEDAPRAPLARVAHVAPPLVAYLALVALASCLTLASIA